jgi:hypothetical protein
MFVDATKPGQDQFRTKRLYIRLTAAEVRRQLIAQKGYQQHRDGLFFQ